MKNKDICAVVPSYIPVQSLLKIRNHVASHQFFHLVEGVKAQLHRTESKPCLNDLEEMGRGQLRAYPGKRPRPSRCGPCTEKSPLPTWILIWITVYPPIFLDRCLSWVGKPYCNANKKMPVHFEPLVGAQRRSALPTQLHYSWWDAWSHVLNEEVLVAQDHTGRVVGSNLGTCVCGARISYPFFLIPE